jgi:hypothetical protein
MYRLIAAHQLTSPGATSRPPTKPTCRLLTVLEEGVQVAVATRKAEGVHRKVKLVREGLVRHEVGAIHNAHPQPQGVGGIGHPGQVARIPGGRGGAAHMACGMVTKLCEAWWRCYCSSSQGLHLCRAHNPAVKSVVASLDCASYHIQAGWTAVSFRLEPCPLVTVATAIEW